MFISEVQDCQWDLVYDFQESEGLHLHHCPFCKEDMENCSGHSQLEWLQAAVHWRNTSINSNPLKIYEIQPGTLEIYIDIDPDKGLYRNLGYAIQHPTPTMSFVWTVVFKVNELVFYQEFHNVEQVRNYIHTIGEFINAQR